MDKSKPRTLRKILLALGKIARSGERISVSKILDGIGRSSFGPLLLLPGLIMITPGVSDIPGVPVILGIFIILISAQLLFGRDYFWLPDWLLERKVDSHKIRKTAVYLRKPARMIDKHLNERLHPLIGDMGAKAISIVAIFLALATPVSELIPFSATLIGAAIAAFGLALIARDGYTCLIGWIFTALTIVLGATAVF